MTSPVESSAHDIARQLTAGPCVLVVGAGISPGGERSINRVLSQIARQLGIADGDIANQQQALLDFAATSISPDAFSEMVMRAFTESPFKEPTWLSNLAELPWHSIIDLNWDDQLERALSRRGNPAIVTAQDDVPQSLSIGSERTVILKPLGSLARSTLLMPSLTSYTQFVNEDGSFHQTLASAIGNTPTLFFGLTARQIDEFMRVIPYNGDSRGVPWRSAICLRSKSENVYERLIQTKYNVRVVAVPRNGFSTAVNAIARRLESQLLIYDDAQLLESTDRPGNRHKVERLELRNIGQFRFLAIELNSNWSLLLGDNGAGKSTILRALASLLAGKGASIEADLLRHDEREGSIEAHIGGIRHRVTLRRDRGEVITRFIQPTPVETGQLLALGFPALRGVSLRTMLGPSESLESPMSGPRDLAPLIHNEVDVRFDEFHQWLLNVAVRGEAGHHGGATRPPRELETVFDLLSSLTDTVTIKYHSVDIVRWQVIVTANDVVLPLKLLSQGVLGTASWVGTLIRRMVEQSSEFGLNRRLTGAGVILLIDEIDAHLHPRWQKRIVPALKRRFPEMQVLASTHSPLIAGSASSGEVMTLSHDTEGIGLASFSPPLAGWRADQILTGPAFRLGGTRDARSEDLLNEYGNLLARSSSLSQQERERLDILSTTIGLRLPRPHETSEERELAIATDATLSSTFDALSPSQRAEVARDARVFLQELLGDHDA